jgi:hypothetical protein
MKVVRSPAIVITIITTIITATIVHVNHQSSLTICLGGFFRFFWVYFTQSL